MTEKDSTARLKALGEKAPGYLAFRRALWAGIDDYLAGRRKEPPSVVDEAKIAALTETLVEGATGLVDELTANVDSLRGQQPRKEQK
jgi:hypothetical protein